MKVLVTGASGRLGDFVFHELLRRGHEPVLFSRSRPTTDYGDLEWIQGDLENYDDCLKAVQDVEAVQHLGARPNPTDHPALRQQSSQSFDATFKTNMLGTYYLMQAVVEAKVGTVVMAGSNCALGHGFRISDSLFPIRYLPIDESHPTYVEDTYSYSKLAGEELLASYTRAFGVHTYVTRICGIFPPERRAELARTVKPVNNWQDYLWCYVASEDVATAHCQLMEASQDLPPHDVYFLNADDTTALEGSRDLVETFRPDLLPVTGRLDNHQSFISAAKLKAAAGWYTSPSWRELL